MELVLLIGLILVCIGCIAMCTYFSKEIKRLDDKVNTLEVRVRSLREDVCGDKWISFSIHHDPQFSNVVDKPGLLRRVSKLENQLNSMKHEEALTQLHADIYDKHLTPEELDEKIKEIYENGR